MCSRYETLSRRFLFSSNLNMIVTFLDMYESYSNLLSRISATINPLTAIFKCVTYQADKILQETELFSVLALTVE